jgi:hypothetical protein
MVLFLSAHLLGNAGNGRNGTRKIPRNKVTVVEATNRPLRHLVSQGFRDSLMWSVRDIVYWQSAGEAIRNIQNLNRGDPDGELSEPGVGPAGKFNGHHTSHVAALGREVAL